MVSRSTRVAGNDVDDEIGHLDNAMSAHIEALEAAVKEAEAKGAQSEGPTYTAFRKAKRKLEQKDKAVAAAEEPLAEAQKRAVELLAELEESTALVAELEARQVREAALASSTRGPEGVARTLEAYMPKHAPFLLTVVAALAR